MKNTYARTFREHPKQKTNNHKKYHTTFDDYFIKTFSVHYQNIIQNKKKHKYEKISYNF